MKSALDPDPREARLPKWASETINVLRMRLNEALARESVTDELVRSKAGFAPVWSLLETTRCEFPAFAVGTDPVVLDLGGNQRLYLRWSVGDAALEINGCDQFAVLPNAANAVMLKPGRFR